MSDIIMVVISVVVTNIVTSVVTVAVMKNDNKWIKHVLGDHENRIRHVERGQRAVHMNEFELGV